MKVDAPRGTGVWYDRRRTVAGRTPNEVYEQLGFLDRSNQLFDMGHLDEAKRLAVTRRVIFHQARLSHALTRQLGLHETLKWLDTADKVNPRNLLPTNGLVVMQMKLGNGGGTTYEAPLDNYPPNSGYGADRSPRGLLIPFDQWWSDVVIKDADGRTFSRKSLILALANKEGGAHVDTDGDAEYKALATSNSLGWTVSDGSNERPMESNPVYPSIRQISHEVLTSVKRQHHLIAGDS